MKIAILYICTGKYDVFWHGFYESSEKYFLINHEKFYFIFTDSAEIRVNNSRIKLIYQQKLGWPYDTLFRFNMFLRIENILDTFDYIYFLNANMIFVSPVDEEVFPKEEDCGLMAVKHPLYYNKQPLEFPYEQNHMSTAYIDKLRGHYYFMGGFNGGIAKSYLDLIRELNKNIQSDLAMKIIAIWHDESHLNQYLNNKQIKILSPSYGYPENYDLPFDAKIIILDKSKFGGHNFLRDVPKNKLEKITVLYSLLYKKFRNKIEIYITKYLLLTSELRSKVYKFFDQTATNYNKPAK